MNSRPTPPHAPTPPCEALAKKGWVIGLTLLTLTLTPVVSAQNAKKKPPPEGVSVTRDLVYANHGGINLKLDLYLPEALPEEPIPAVVWVHGGGWLNGSKDNCKATFLAQEGFAVASIEYRLTDVAQWPAQINDCYAATRWLRANGKRFGIDSKHIGAWGGSAGGHLAALMGTRSFGKREFESNVDAVCDWYGPSDLLTMPPNNVSEKRTVEQVANSNGAKLLGATVRKVPDLAKDASALYRVSSQAPPFLIMHGSEDPGVPIEQSKRLHEALQDAGVDSTFVVVVGAGHGGKEFQTDEVRKTVIDFFNRTLKP